MRIAHRIRMYLLMRRSNIVLDRAKARRDHMNRPHQQSVHMVGWPLDEPQIGYTTPTPFWIGLIVFFVALLVYLNVYHHDAAPAQSACQVANSK